ncbi:MAG: hypothetical protein IJT09_01965, partial [Abditibacteriota bacterium]|nr:hypothetical protein [Abditibacteriota bacterium]
MKKTFFVFLLWICAAAAFSEESVRTEFDNVVFRAADCVTVGQSEVRPAEKGMSVWRFAVNRGRSQLFGIDFKGKAPLPKRIMFSVESKVRLPLIVGVADSKGNRAFCRDYMIVSGNGRDNFNISFDDFIPFALGAPAVEDVSSVFIGSCTTVEDFVRTPGFKDMYISDVTLRFPYGKAIPQKYTRSQIETHARRVEAKRDALKSLLDRIKSKGFSCRYETASYTVVNQFIGYARKEAEEGKTDRAHNQLEYIESLSEETLASLEAIDKDPSKHIEYKVPNMSDISVKDGVCYSGGRPVFLVGVMGWFGPEDCETIYNTGFDYVSFEFPLSEDFDPGKFAEKKTLLDSVAKNNLALSVLLAPHYVDDVAREKYPNIDPTGLRSRNLFTPWCIESDDFRAMVKDHVDYIVPKIRGYKNLVGYDLANELMYPVLPDFDYKRFTESGFDYPDPWTAQAEYSKEVMYRFMEYYVGCVKTWDDTRPIFFKILSPKPEAMGFDSERVSDIVTGHGLDAFITPNDRDYGLAIDNVYESLALDKYRSKDPNKTITDGEYHLIDYTEERLKCSAEFVNAALWSGFVRGKDMSAIWLWDRDFEN